MIITTVQEAETMVQLAENGLFDNDNLEARAAAVADMQKVVDTLQQQEAASMAEANARINAKFAAGMDRTLPNARFWVYVNDNPVKLTLKPGQSLHYESGGDTDEGWCFEYTDWTYTVEADGPYVTREWCQEARDCDGRIDRTTTHGCPVDGLCVICDSACIEEVVEIGPTEDDALFVAYPMWNKLECSQRDRSAEAMGY